ncbi:MAG: carbon-nitrogen hydrolase family protein [Thaumarchaeota archaeon]|nr:carbon-nitrogen hydrolase family protein [Nitrososphaerota archaeon]
MPQVADPGFKVLRVAAISMKADKWKVEENADKMERLFRRAGRLGAKVAVITEGALQGYVVMEAIKSPKRAEKMLAISEQPEGPHNLRFGQLAKDLGMCICLGLSERVGGDVYNAALFIDDQGRIRGRHYKMQFAEGNDPGWYFNRMGQHIRAFDTPYGRAGFLICNDRWDKTLARALVLDGARVIYILAYGDKSHKQDRVLVETARENGVPIVEANVGANLIISKGEIVARARGEDDITVADIAVPLAQSEEAVRELEREFLTRRGPEMKRRYAKTMASLAGGRDPNFGSFAHEASARAPADTKT